MNMRIRVLGVISLGALILLATFPARAELPQGKNQVLIIHSYHSGLTWTDAIMDGIRDAFVNSGSDIQMSAEYLDARRYPKSELSGRIRDVLVSKIKGATPNLVMVSDNQALNFILEQRKRLFPDIPVVFCGINDFSPSMISQNPGITGVAEELSILETVNLALQLHPDTREIIVIGRTSVAADRHNRDSFVASLSKLPPRLKVTFWDDLPGPELKARLERQESGSVLFINGLITDPSGRQMMYGETTKWISQYSKVPAYSLWDVYLGYGIVGGKLVSGYRQGQMAGEIALRILNGERAGGISVIAGLDANRYMFDYRQLQRFAIPLSKLPPDAVVINRSNSFYEKYKRLAWAIVSVVSTLGLLVILLSVAVFRQRKAERALKISEEKFSTSFLKSPIPMAITAMKDSRYVDVNEAFARVMGCKREDLLGNTSGGAAFITEEQRALFLDEYRQKGFVENLELPIRAKDNKLRYGLLNASKIVIGEEEFILTQATDITDRKRDREALRSSEQFLSLITENVHDAVRLLDLKTLRYTYANSYCQTLFGIPAQNYINLELGFNLEEESKKLLVQIVRNELEHDRERDPDRSSTFELRERNIRTNEMFWTENKASFLRDANGNPIAIVSITRDITERKKMEEERRKLQDRLQRAEKMEALGQLAGGVAHDLNNVLGALSGYSELLMAEIPNEQRARNYAEKILKSTGKGAAIIQDLLTLARRGVMVSDVINLNDIVSGFFKTPVFEKLKDYHPQVAFRTEYDQTLLNIKGSPVHLEKTVMNLISNAAEAISGQGEVTIRTENRYLDKAVSGYDEVKEGDYIVLTVADTGIGIPAEHRDKIFEPFYTKKTMGRSGTGLGLAIVWGTVKDHNGYIDVQSNVGEGTAFTLYFPATREERTAPQRKKPLEEYMGRGESLLVVDDIAEQRDVASGLLMQLGYKVHAVASGEEAVEYLQSNKVDLLVLDMIMAPGMDGLETYRKVLEINPQQKAVLVSGFSETDRVRKAQHLGAGAYIKKPYVMEKIGLAIRDELHR